MHFRVGRQRQRSRAWTEQCGIDAPGRQVDIRAEAGINDFFILNLSSRFHYPRIILELVVEVFEF